MEKKHSCNTWGFYHVGTNMKTQTENKIFHYTHIKRF